MSIERAARDWGAYQLAMNHYVFTRDRAAGAVAKILLADHFVEVEKEVRRRRPELYDPTYDAFFWDGRIHAKPEKA